MRAYEQAGVDALFIVGLKSQAQLAAVSEATTLPLILGNAGGDLAGADLAAQRVRIALQGHATIMAAVQAVYDTMKALREGIKPSALKNVASGELDEDADARGAITTRRRGIIWRGSEAAIAR